MPSIIRCPQCQQALNLPETAHGKKVRCPDCQGVFTAEIPAAPLLVEPVQFAQVVLPVEPAPVRSSDQPYDADDRPLRRGRRRDRDDDDVYDYPDIEDRRMRYLPHRGGMILTFGIISIVLMCAPLIGTSFAIAAITMANNDHYAFASGRMDRAGRNSAEIGKTCGIIGLVLGILFFVVAVCLRIAGGR